MAHKPRRYSVLVIPEKDSHIRRIEFSRRTLRTVVGTLIATGVFVCAAFIALAHFYAAYGATEEVRIRAAVFEGERLQMIAKVAELEDALARTQRFAVKLETVSHETDQAKAGFGPLEGHMRSLKEAIAQQKDVKGADGAAMWKAPSTDLTNDELLGKVDLLKDNTAQLEELLHEVFAQQQDKLFFWSSLPTLWPSMGFMTSRFGSSRGFRLHDGIDVAGPVGTSINAPGDGIVTYTGYKGGYGNAMIVDHGYGLSTLYGHCSRIFAAEGDRVKRGQLIAAVGNTGSSTGPHLHYEVHLDGMPVNPLKYLAQR